MHYLDRPAGLLNRRPNHTKMILVILNLKVALTLVGEKCTGSSTGKTSITVAIINQVASSVIPLKIPTVFTVTPDLISTCMRMAPTVRPIVVNFHDDMFLYGIGYNFTGSGWWFKRFFEALYRSNLLHWRQRLCRRLGCRLQLYAGQREIHSYQLERVRV